MRIFHEQNHLLIWNALPPPPRDQQKLFLYILMAESIAVILDYALAHELGEPLSTILFLSNIIVRSDRSAPPISQDMYRCYLGAIGYSLFLHFNKVSAANSLRLLGEVYPQLHSAHPQLLSTALNQGRDFNHRFIEKTLLRWFWRHHKHVATLLKKDRLTDLRKATLRNNDAGNLENFRIYNSAVQTLLNSLGISNKRPAGIEQKIRALL